MTPEQYRELYRQRQARPIRTDFTSQRGPQSPLPNSGPLHTVKNTFTPKSGGCCGRKRSQ